MLTPADHFHGSDLEIIEQVYGIKKESITSFSANVNPLGISPKLRKALADHIDVITGYPDRNYTALRTAIASYVNCISDNIIVGNGSTELISLMIQIKNPKKAMILGPTYSEYEREISLGGGTSLYYPLKESDNFQIKVNDFTKVLNEQIDLLVICNPNNPTSTAISQDDMRLILDCCKQNDIFVMIDETYVEFVPSQMSVTSVPLTGFYNNLIILRGVSKFFAAPGLRLGYAITGNQDLLKEINKKKNPWTINSLAEVAGKLMFSDTDYIEKTRQLIFSERDHIIQVLSEIEGLKFYPPTANFILVKILKNGITSKDVFECAIKRGLMIRDCSTFPFLGKEYFRFCFMSPQKNQELLDCLVRNFY